MKHQRTVESSHLQEVEYDDETHELVVTFKGGSRYRYDAVPMSHYEALVESESAGRYLALHIKPDYAVTRL